MQISHQISLTSNLEMIQQAGNINSGARVAFDGHASEKFNAPELGGYIPR
jgi:hypothetical protein